MDQVIGTPGSEKNGSKIVVILTSVVGVLGVITSVVDQVSSIVPASAKWIGPVVAVVGVVAAAMTQIAYTVMRTWIKVEALKAGQTSMIDLDKPADPNVAAANLGK